MKTSSVATDIPSAACATAGGIRYARPSRRILSLFVIAGVLLILFPGQAQAYIGPGAGFAVAGSFLVMFTTILSAMLALFTWPIRYAFRALKGRRAFARSRTKRFVVLGLDGMDPKLTQQFLDEGRLPNLAKLRDTGCFKPLRTTIPSISPVAWSSFQTGVNPGKHNIFDFLTRDKHSYMPKLSSVDIKGPRRTLNLGKYRIPLGKPDIRLLRKGKPFWKTLGEHGIFSNVIRVPITFPPEKFYGVQLSAMCVPDIRGTQGTFSFYTTAAKADIEHTGGENFYITKNGNTLKSELVGCENPLTKELTVLKCPFAITIRDENSADLKVNGATWRLQKGEYTEWLKVPFKAAPGVKIHGICRFLLLDTEPELKLYVTPINIDPEKPAMPISHPSIYSTYFAKQQGPFATLGLAEDSWALNEKILDDKSFLEQCLENDREREEMFFDALNKTRHGLCVCVFDGMDRIQHTFWRYIDKGHPADNAQVDSGYRDTIEKLYERMDVLVGKTMAKCSDADTVFMVISDHGFNTFRYGVDLNRWLEENGYLKVIEDRRDEKYLTAIDWSQTRAFATGLSGIFLNIKGRESKGIVKPGKEADDLREEIAAKLTELVDPERDQNAIKQVYNALKIYRGPYKGEAPDLLVGYNRGYRASWETAIGQVTKGIFHDNTRAWSGDHCIDHTLVPGVLFCNRPVETERPRLMDIGPTVLEMFGVDVPGNMDGKPLTVADHNGIANDHKAKEQLPDGA
ncbi:MAG: alkaline phosphatase family protein [Planctomycetes bacterium]|nr:alkaline phosphatase family protein [Planctomycetota bacterium]